MGPAVRAERIDLLHRVCPSPEVFDGDAVRLGELLPPGPVIRVADRRRHRKIPPVPQRKTEIDDAAVFGGQHGASFRYPARTRFIRIRCAGDQNLFMAGS